MTLVRVCRVEDLPPGKAICLKGAVAVAIFNVGGSFFAVSDECTHAKASLSEGYLEGEIIECPLHRARFSVKTGVALSLPAIRSLQTFEVRIIDGHVHVARSAGEGAADGIA